MEVLNLTPFTFAYIAGKVLFPNNSLTLIVKGTFDLSPKAVAIPSEEQIFPTGDEFYPGDDDMLGGARYSSDFAFFKPRADLLCVGKCHAPRGTKVTGRQVTVQVGTKSKTLNVFGYRYWKRGILGSSATDPEAFTDMELRYENSFGGEGYKKNPVGKGFNVIETAPGKKRRPLPAITGPDDHLTSPGVKLEPAGFGPIGRGWQQRYMKLGTYKGNYMKERWPWFPVDFDWGYFNAAPEDMQVEGYLTGNENLYFENLHPDHLQYRSQLPGQKIRCFLNKTEPGKPDVTYFQEVPMRLDTLQADMEAERLTLVWRGVADILTDEYTEIQHAFIVSEDLNSAPQAIDYYQDLFIKSLKDYESQWEVKPEKPDISEALAKDNEEPDDAEADKIAAEAEVNIKSAVAESGRDPDNLPPPTREEIEAEAKIMENLGPQKEEVENPAITREIVVERIARKEGFAGEDLSGLDLSSLQLSDTDFQNVILTGANLQKSDLSGSNLSGANLAGSDLSGSDLSKAIFTDADLTGSVLEGANLTGASLKDAVFENAKLENAVLDEASAKDANFADANLKGASLKRSDLNGANFSKCAMDRANFHGANLSQASLEGAAGIQVNMSEADLTGLRASEGCNFTKGSFHKAIGPESIWQGAILDEAEFAYADMEGADFTSASLKKAVLSCANMKFTRFTKADLSEARSGFMNLFQGSLEKADLSRADFSGANLYEVEFLESVIHETKFEFANLKMTKLAKQ